MHPGVRHAIHQFKRERESRGLYTSNFNHWCSKLNSNCRIQTGVDNRGKPIIVSTVRVFEIPHTNYIFSGCTIHGRYHVCGYPGDPCVLVDVCEDTGNIVCQMSGRHLGEQQEPTYEQYKGSISEYRAGNASFQTGSSDQKEADEGDGYKDSEMADEWEEAGEEHDGNDDEDSPADNPSDDAFVEDEMDEDEPVDTKHRIDISESQSIDKYNRGEVIRHTKSREVSGASQFDFLPIVAEAECLPPKESAAIARPRNLPKPVDPLPIYNVFRDSAYIKNRLAITKCRQILSGKVTIQTSIDQSLAKRVNAFLSPAVITIADVFYSDKCSSIATAAVIHMFVHPGVCDDHHAVHLTQLYEYASELASPKKKYYTDTKNQASASDTIDGNLKTFVNNLLRASLELLRGGYRVNSIPIIECDTYLRDLLMISCLEPGSKRSQRKTRHDINTTKPEKKDAENTENQLKACLNHMVATYGTDFTRTRVVEFCDIPDPHYVTKLRFQR